MFNTIDTQIFVAIIGAMVAVISIPIGKYFEKRREIANDIRKLKLPIYEELMAKAIEFLMSPGKTEKEQAQKLDDIKKYFGKANPQFIAWASEEFIHKWKRFTYATSGNSGESPLLLFEDVMFAIRRELGHSNKSLKKGDLLKMFIREHDAVDGMIAESTL